jgi:hypothetical protein
MLYNGTGYEEVDDISLDLCGGCHQGDHHTETADWSISAHADTTMIPGVNNNTYCAHCMSPFQGDPDANSSVNDPVDAADWDSIGCIVCHNKHSLELELFNGSAYSPVEDISRDLCGACHQGSHHPETEEWNSSAHADSFHAGANNNTYCAHCMSPYQAGPEDEWDRDTPVLEDDWDSIGCIVCHDKHSLELKFFNGSEYNDVDDISRDLCGACHQGSHHTETADWNASAHSNTFHAGANNNTYCAHCMSPYQAGAEDEWDRDTPVLEDDWDSIGCIVCHNKHSLELEFFNGSEYNPIEDISRELCGACHQGSHHTETADWNGSAHANTFHAGANNNTYCAHCMSPFQAGAEDEWDRDTPVLEDDLVFFNGSENNPVEDISRDLCGACHQGSHHTETADWNSSKHASSYHGYNDNTYCAHCMSPYQGDPDATSSVNDPVGAGNWTSIGCIVCHDKHSLELVFFNGSEYEEIDDISRDLCGACHQGSHHTETADWDSGAHSNTFHAGANNNTYCAHCMSPFQAGAEDEWNRDTPVLEDDWDSIGCIVCHDKHSLELVLFNGSEYNPIEDISRDLCGACHQGSHHTETADWNASAHANTFHAGANNNTYCAHCMSPYQAGPEDEWNRSTEVLEEDWESIGCIVCHDEHSLELAFFNGSERQDAVTNPAELCGACHQGSHHPEYPDWNSSAHSDSYGAPQGNTYCAKCMSPFQADPDATHDVNNPVAEGDWTGITCTVCHQPHSLELVLYNGSEYNEVVNISQDLCGACHDIANWEASAHFNTYKGFNGNTYCAHCMSPFQAGDEATQAARETVSEDNWTSIGCMVCHDKHSLELTLYNGSAYVEVNDNTNTLCGSCHTMGDATIGDEPHHSQIEMRTGTGAIGVADMPYMPSAQCAGCHAYENNHTFHFHEAACVECHTTKTNGSALAEIMGWQAEVQELMDATEENLTFAEMAMMSAKENNTWNETMNTTYYTALFNYEFVVADGTTGAHNPEYAKELLKLADKGFIDILNQVDILPSIKVTPAADATDVPIETMITVQFENDINFTDLEANGLLTVDGVAGTLTYDNETFTVTFDPTNDLDYDTTYTARLNNAVTYADGSSILREDYNWSFTTEEEVIIVTDITLKIGPILDEDDEPLKNAKVTITLGNKTYSGLTDAEGMAEIVVPADEFSAGTYDIKVTKDGYEDLKFDGTLDSDGNVTSAIPDMKESKEDEENYTLLIIAIIIVILIVIILLALAARRKAPAEEEEEEEAEEGEEAETEKQKKRKKNSNAPSAVQL